MANVKTTHTGAGVLLFHEVADIMVTETANPGDTVTISDAQQTILEEQDGPAWGPQAIVIASVSSYDDDGSTDRIVEVHGTGFTKDSVVRLDGDALDSEFVTNLTLIGRVHSGLAEIQLPKPVVVFDDPTTSNSVNLTE